MHTLYNCFSLAHRSNSTCHRATAKLCCSHYYCKCLLWSRASLKRHREKSPHSCTYLAHYRLLLTWHVGPEAVGLLHQCNMHLSTSMAPLNGDGIETLSPLIHKLWYLLLGGWREREFTCKRQDKNCRSEEKIEGSRKMGGGSDYSCAGLGNQKKVFSSNQSADLAQISWKAVKWITISGGFIFFVCFAVIESITSQLA